MAVEAEDFKLISRYRQKFSTGTSCAILGDCHIADNLNLKDLGFDKVDTFDILGDPTYKVDLNQPISNQFFNKYDWVIDSGTLYCCFNIAGVLENILNMLKDDGCCLHTSNLCGWYGRGFYSLSPSLYKEFYQLNNFTIEGMGTKTRFARVWHDIDVNATYLSSVSKEKISFEKDPSPFIEALPNDSLLYCFVSRVKRTEFREPVPEHYIHHATE